MKKSKKIIKINNSNIKKLKIMGLLSFFILLLLILRLAYLQFIKGDWLSRQASSQQTSTRTITPERGIIYDANGKVLAMSAEVDTVSVNPSRLKYSDDLSIFHEKYDKTSREKIPPYIDEIIDNFLKLRPAKQNCLYRSCYSYLEAKRTIGPRSLFFSYQAIDNIVWYKEKIGEYPSGQRSNNINNLLNKYYNGYFSKNIDSEVIKWWDENRNKFAHNGIEENDLTNIIIERTYDTLYIKNIEHDVADFVYIIIISELNNSLNK